MPCLFALNCSAALIFSVGLDRLLAILYATECVMALCRIVLSNLARHNAWNRKRYIASLTLPAVVLAAVLEGAVYVEVLTNNYIVPCCYPPTVFGPKGARLWVAVNSMICIAVMCVYAVTYRKAQKQLIVVWSEAFVNERHGVFRAGDRFEAETRNASSHASVVVDNRWRVR